MHLLFDDRTYAFLGSVQETSGAIQDIDVASQGRSRLNPLLRRWRKEGIGVLKLARHSTSKGGTTDARRQTISLASSQAFEALLAIASEQSLCVCSLDARRAKYWREMTAWLIPDRFKFELIWAAKNVAKQDLPTWDTAWKALVAKMATI